MNPSNKKVFKCVTLLVNLVVYASMEPRSLDRGNLNWKITFPRSIPIIAVTSWIRTNLRLPKLCACSAPSRNPLITTPQAPISLNQSNGCDGDRFVTEIIDDGWCVVVSGFDDNLRVHTNSKTQDIFKVYAYYINKDTINNCCDRPPNTKESGINLRL